MNHTTSSVSRPNAERLPLGGLLALAMAAFITLLTEIMPAGLLSSIAEGLNVSESLAGQFITAYAVGALVAAIPVTTLTQGMRRRPLLLAANPKIANSSSGRRRMPCVSVVTGIAATRAPTA